MGLIERIQNTARRALGIRQTDGLSVSWNGLIVGDVNRSSAGINITPDRAMQVASVYACIRVISESLASLPLIVYRRSGESSKERAVDYPLYDVLRSSPNQWQTSFEFREMMAGHLCLRGNFYSRILPGLRGAVDQLIPMHPDRMKVEMLETGRVRYVYTNDNGRPEPYTQDEIFHVRGLSCDGLVGLSPIAAARNALGLTIATEDHGAKLFKNGARPGVVLSSEQPIKPETADQVRSSWEKTYAGSDNQHRTAILPFGLKPVELGLSNDDAQFLDTRKYQRSEIAGIFRVPLHKIGDLDRATFSNIEEQNIDFVQDTLLPWARRIEEAISRDLIIEPDVYFAEHLFEGRLRGNAAARSTFYREMWNLGVLSVNEIRALENMNPIGPDGDKRFVQTNMTTLEKAGEEPPEATPPTDSGGDEQMAERKRAVDAGYAAMKADTKRLLRWEVDAVNRLASKGGNFLAGVNEFYDKHLERHLERLKPMASVLNSLGCAIDVDAMAEGYLYYRHGLVVEAAGNCTADTLKETVEHLTNTWIKDETEGGENVAA